MPPVEEEHSGQERISPAAPSQHRGGHRRRPNDAAGENDIIRSLEGLYGLDQ